MKYVSLIVILGLMIWSWSLATAQPSFSLESHKRVEESVEKDIQAFIVRKYPQTTDIYCQQFYTETITAGEEMNVHFRCSSEGNAADDEKVQQIFEGKIRIASKDGFQSWDEVGGEINSPEVNFQNGSKISAKPGAAAADEPAAEEPEQAESTSPKTPAGEPAVGHETADEHATEHGAEHAE